MSYFRRIVELKQIFYEKNAYFRRIVDLKTVILLKESLFSLNSGI